MPMFTPIPKYTYVHTYAHIAHVHTYPPHTPMFTPIPSYTYVHTYAHTHTYPVAIP